MFFYTAMYEFQGEKKAQVVEKVSSRQRWWRTGMLGPTGQLLLTQPVLHYFILSGINSNKEEKSSQRVCQ